MSEHSGHDLLERAFAVRDKHGVESAALFLEAAGVNQELAILALVGSERARHHGVHAGRICSRAWRHGD